MPTSPAPAASATPTVVLDTNTVLDWLVFRDPGMAAVSAAVITGRLRWLACPAMRAELTRTLGYRTLARWHPDSEHALSVFDRRACLLPTPPAAALHFRCSDPDDQVFLDLALAHRVGWLFTHDRALLRLARRARGGGVCITQPRHWPPAAGPA